MSVNRWREATKSLRGCGGVGGELHTGVKPVQSPFGCTLSTTSAISAIPAISGMISGEFEI